MSKKNQRVIVEELARVGLKPHAIAGILANLEHENAFRTTLNNGDGGQASGIAQWHPDRFARVIRVAKKMGLKPTDIRAQARTLALSIVDEKQSGPTGTTTVESLNSLKNAAAVAKFFDENYERSSGATRQARMQAASNYLKIARRGGKGTAGEAPVRKVPGSSNGTMTWVPKVGTDVSNPFGAKNQRYADGWHTGTDIPGGSGGQPIRWAPKVSGKVVKQQTDPNNDYGYYVIIRDDMNRDWLLAHLQGPGPKVGTKLQQGDRIGKVGDSGTNSSGAHLHIEMTAPGTRWSYGDVKKPKLVFKVGTNGRTYDKDFKPVEEGDYLDAIGLSGQAINRPGNEELQRLIDKAEQKDWTTQEFTRRFKNTQWYKERAGSQRQFDMMQDTDQQQSIKQATAEAKAMAAQLGIELEGDEARKLAIKMKRDGFTQEQALWWLSKRFEYSPEQIQTGVAAEYEDDLKQFAREYGVRIDDSDYQRWIQNAIGRGVDIKTYEEQVRDIAYKQNPWLREAYDRGLSTRDALLSKLSTAANVLGLSSVDDIDLTDAKWRDVFDQNGNEISDHDWIKQLKSDQRYRYGWTENGIREAEDIGRNMLRAMGGIGNGI